MKSFPATGAAFALGAVLAPAFSWACACGCDVFDVGTATMLASQPGGVIFLEDDYQNQDQNWVGSHAAPADANSDKEIETHFGGVGFDYQFNGAWGMTMKVPYWKRLFRTDTGTPGAPDIMDFRHSGIGDVRISGRYTGFSPDLTTGITVGLKLATGGWTYPNFDRDTSLGTGTTDLLLGAYHLGMLSERAHLNWFAEALYDRAFNTRNGYRPGNETVVAAGIVYNGLQLGQRGSLATLLQVSASDRLRDSGVNSDSMNSGYKRVLLSPGVEAGIGHWKYYADAEFRIYHYANAAPSLAAEGTRGQLVAPVLLKIMVSYHW